MWPRGGDPGETSRSVNGFVCFHERSAAEDAVQHCRFHLCFGRQLRTGWGKPILMQQQQQQQQQPQRPHPPPSTNNNTDIELTPHEMEEYRRIIQQELLAPARQRICTAMAFCFDKSRAARHICRLLQQEMMTTRSVDTTLAYLYLLSDILYNSQQPGIRNAFMYRDAIHNMCPAVFAHWRTSNTWGRLRRDRLSHAVSAVLSAWTMWGVYDATYLDALEAAYKGRKDQSIVPRGSAATDIVSTATKNVGVGSVTSASVNNDNGKQQISSGAGVKDEPPMATPPPSSTVTASTGDVTTCPPRVEDDDDIDGLPLEDADYDGIVDVDPEDPFLTLMLQQRRLGRHMLHDGEPTKVEDDGIDGKLPQDDVDEEPLEPGDTSKGDRRDQEQQKDVDLVHRDPFDVDDVDGQPLGNDDDIVMDDQ